MAELLKLLMVFFQIGLFSIGGGYAIIPFIQQLAVEKYAWVSQRVFTDIITISQMTPGPLAVNTSTFVGLQIAGIPGAIISTFGCVISGVCISIMLYRFFQRFNQSVYVLEALNGLRSASLGLIISAAATILLLTFTGTSTMSVATNVDWIAVAVFIGSLFVLRKWKMNPIFLMVLTGILGGIIQ
ncbi:chromate transporter [Paenibacillus sp. p3-SID867]|uniref:chromate transporter n=1 Tax=Paenibacillus sp. p3-SID867 TaxID=2916363 RepID=UPI0021A5E18D|nr:chromate transporter [Paenibacillus sp. p3-SID867]MCT1401097.1 chromate transporter [Paenibacillus sp. p3-SID867]